MVVKNCVFIYRIIIALFVARLFGHKENSSFIYNIVAQCVRTIFGMCACVCSWALLKFHAKKTGLNCCNRREIILDGITVWAFSIASMLFSVEYLVNDGRIKSTHCQSKCLKCVLNCQQRRQAGRPFHVSVVLISYKNNAINSHLFAIYSHRKLLRSAFSLASFHCEVNFLHSFDLRLKNQFGTKYGAFAMPIIICVSYF